MLNGFRLLAAIVAFGIVAAPATADDNHSNLGGAVKAFHDTLSPNWHSPAGAARNTAACRNAGTYVSQAKAISRQPAPLRADDRAWPQTAAALRDASVALSAYCTSGQDANVLAGLTTLHDRFHDLLKAVRPPDEN